MSEMVKFEIPIEILRYICAAYGPDDVQIDDVILLISDNKIILKHRNRDGSAMINYESPCLDLKDIVIEVPIAVVDIKGLLNLTKKGNIEFEVGPGETICRFGKVKKSFPQPGDVEKPSKTPVLEKMNNVFNVTMSQMQDLVKGFKDVDKDPDVTVSSKGYLINFSVMDEKRRGTDVGFVFDELEMKSSGDALSRYDQKVFRALLSAIEEFKEGKFQIEFGDDYPLRITQSTPELGTLIMMLAPKFVDND
jgi:hypothetical protein